MHIDWTELERGFNEEAEKTAFDWGWLKKIRPGVKPALGAGAAAGGVGYGISKVNDFTQGIGNALEAVKPLAPVALTGLMGMFGGSGANQAKHQNTVYIPEARKPSLLTPDPGTVSSVANPRAYADPVKQADVIFDSLGDAVKRRIANSVINEVTKTNPLGLDMATEGGGKKPKDPREVELTTSYPEIEELLKDEKNRAYLQKLMR